jgi:membrane protein YdbS with pleckstrin-like domain
VDVPSQRLPAAARTYWRLVGAAQGLAVVVVVMSVGGSLGGAWWIALVVAVAILIVLGAVVPELRWRRWRYAIRDEEVDLLRGAFVVRRTIIPIRRVQHVDTQSGPLQEPLGLATVTFHTAAGGVGIPALGKGEAERVRARVAELARTRDDT